MEKNRNRMIKVLFLFPKDTYFQSAISMFTALYTLKRPDFKYMKYKLILTWSEDRMKEIEIKELLANKLLNKLF
jgi:hypothetical protein